jgi:hypothetical protein
VKISNKKFSFFSSRNQYFPHIPYVASKKERKIIFFLYFFFISFSLSTYEIWKVLVSLAIKYFFIANFHVLGLFIPKKQV